MLAVLLALGGCAAFQLPRESSTSAAPPAQATAQAPSAPAAAGAPAAPAPAAAAPAAAPPAPPPPPPVPFEQAILNAANTLFSGAKLPAPGTEPRPRYPLVIDPLVDGVTGAQSGATRSMGKLITDLARAKYPQFDVQQFSADSISQAPLVLVGTFTGLNKEGKPIGQRDVYRVCLVLADLRSGKTVGKGTARALPGGFDLTPAAYFRDSPAWRPDRLIEGYIKTCQGTRPGDPIDQGYLDGILSAALVSDAISAYEEGRYQEALDLYRSAAQTPGGDQLRVYNGLYMANWKLGQRDQAAEAFGQLVDYGLKNDRIAVKFLFKPGSTSFWPDAAVTEPYPFWLRQIAQRTAQSNACLEISGHTSPTGPAPLNERLSLLRAEFIKSRLEQEAPPLASRMITNGVGARENIIGSGADDVTDALDRRVEFKPINC